MNGNNKNPASIDELKQIITEKISSITPTMMQNVSKNLVRHAHVYIQNGGAYFQHLL